MSFNIVRNDITRMEVDAVVNAANSRLLQGGGVCGAIFNAAGAQKLQKACEKIGFCGVGEAVVTKGYNLPAKYVIHTVGPIYRQGNSIQEEQLFSCYKNSLDLAKAKRIKSIAFPLISSGAFGYPKAEALAVARRAIADFLLENEMDIYLVVYDTDTFEISKALFEKIRNFIGEKMIVLQTQERSRELAEFCQYPSVANGGSALNGNFQGRRSLDERLDSMGETFSQMLLRLIDERGMDDPEVYKKANVDRKLFSKIRNNKNYSPKKSTVFSFAIALGLSLDETRDLLSRAGFTFSSCSKADIIVEYFIENKNYDIFEINEALFAFDQPLLNV